MMHDHSSKPKRSPHKGTVPAYGQKRQYTKTLPSLPIINNELTNVIQQKTGSILYFGRAIDYTVSQALIEIAQTQAKPTAYMQDEMSMLMDECATYPSSVIRFHTRNMILHMDTDAVYLVAPGAKIRIAGYYYLSYDRSKKPDPSNAPFQIVCKFLKHVVASATKAKIAGVFLNDQEIIFIWRLLVALGHPQSPTFLTTNNSTSSDFVNKNMRIKRSKLWDMRFHWLRNTELKNKIIVN